MLLNDKGRRSDIGKQDSLCESQLEYIKHITAVVNNDAETAERCPYACLRTFLGRQRLFEADTSDAQQNADEQQNHKNSLPAYAPCQQTSDDRSSHRRHSIDCSDHSQHLSQFFSRKLVCRHRTGNHNSPCPGYTLYQPQSDKRINVRLAISTAGVRYYWFRCYYLIKGGSKKDQELYNETNTNVSYVGLQIT